MTDEAASGLGAYSGNPAKLPSTGPIEILLVEDNPNDVKLAMHAFKKHNLAISVQVVRDGAEALEYLFCTGSFSARDIRNVPKLILLDLKLPKVDGLEVLRRVKADARTRATPVVMMTSSREERDVVESYHLGVNSYIVKPVDYSQLSMPCATLVSTGCC
jgi:two-component system response regulator